MLTSRLECIGEEYFDKMNFIDEISVEGIKEALLRCFSNREELYARAEKAAAHIREYKNVDHQAGVVADFISGKRGSVSK